MDKLKIMIVDDESRMRKLVKDFLKKKDFEVGTMVLHPKFGIGNVMKVDGSGDNKSVTVNFKTVGVKTLVLSFAPLRIIK